MRFGVRWCAVRPRLAVVFFLGSVAALSGCSSGADALLGSVGGKKSAHINNKVKFSAKTMGIKASPRVTTSRRVPKGGGRRYLGKRYKINGQWFTPKREPNYDRSGQASWYGPNFHGRLTANGEVYDQYALSAAHPTLPMPSYARVTNLKNGRSTIVRINDRGPFHHRRIIDLSAAAAKLLDFQKAGVADVRVQFVGDAPLHGRDARYLKRSFRQLKPGQRPNAVRVARTTRSSSSSGIKRPKASVTNPGALDPMTTSGVKKADPKSADKTKGNSKSKAKLKAEPMRDGKPDATDPFISELNRLKSKKDTGTTAAARALRGSP
ncbi:MAG: septal ring lytic transglycosylase RlpA family protein [Pseudomonadota bacterium]